MRSPTHVSVFVCLAVFRIAAAFLLGFRDGDPRKFCPTSLDAFTFSTTSADNGKTWSP